METTDGMTSPTTDLKTGGYMGRRLVVGTQSPTTTTITTTTTIHETTAEPIEG